MADERRLTTRMITRWSALSRDQRMPRQADLILDAFGEDLPNCVLIETAGEIGVSKLVYVGELLRNEGWSPERQQIVADYPINSLLRLATAKIPAVMAKRGPISFGGTGVRDVSAILYRAILLPLSDDGEAIDHVMGAINFREITAVQEYAETSPTAAPAQPTAADRVNAYMAFASRRVAFAPSAARKPMQVTIK